MATATIFKLAKALFLFFREIWLRDRTFRQFVHENLPLIVMSIGFMVMATFFVYVSLIVMDQDAQLKQRQFEMTQIQRQHAVEMATRDDQVDWYKNRIIELQARPVAPAPAGRKPPDLPRTPTTDKPTALRGPSPEMVERWKRLSQ